MHKSKNRQAGFGVIEIIIIIAVVALVGFVGWRLVEANNSKKDASNHQQPSTSQTNNNSSTLPADTSTYLDIKELGVRIKLSDSIKDAVYYYDTSSSGSGYERVTVSTQSLIDESDGTCKPTLGISPLGTIMKTKKTVDDLGRTFAPNGSTVFRLGEDFVIASTPQSPCSSNADVEALAKIQRATFFEDFKSVQLNL